MQDFAFPWTSNFKILPRDYVPGHPHLLNHYKMKTWGFQGPKCLWGTLFIIVDQLKMQYSSVWPRASHARYFVGKKLHPPKG